MGVPKRGDGRLRRTGFHYALARLAVARNLVVAAAVAVMCLGVVGLTLWAAGVQRTAQAKPEWLPELPQGPAEPEEPLFEQYQLGEYGPTLYMVDPNEHPELYVPVVFAYKCGHTGRFTPADNQGSAYDPAGYKAKLEQRLCPACQAQEDYKAKRAAQAAEKGDG
jgi:hypothetical protein